MQQRLPPTSPAFERGKVFSNRCLAVATLHIEGRSQRLARSRGDSDPGALRGSHASRRPRRGRRGARRQWRGSESALPSRAREQAVLALPVLFNPCRNCAGMPMLQKRKISLSFCLWFSVAALALPAICAGKKGETVKAETTAAGKPTVLWLAPTHISTRHLLYC